MNTYIIIDVVVHICNYIDNSVGSDKHEPNIADGGERTAVVNCRSSLDLARAPVLGKQTVGLMKCYN